MRKRRCCCHISIVRLLLLFLVCWLCLSNRIVVSAEDEDNDDDYYEEDDAIMDEDYDDSEDDNNDDKQNDSVKTITTVTKDDVERFLQDSSALDEELNKTVAQLMQESVHIQSLQQELLERTVAVDAMIRQVNALQMEYLATQLNQSLEESVTHYEQQQDILETARQEQSNKKTLMEQDADKVLANAVSLQELKQTLDPSRILSETVDKELEEWIVQTVLPEEMSKQQRVLHEQQTSRAKAAAEAAAAAANPPQCVTPSEAVHMVQSSLMSQEGRPNHATSEGTRIVYELTSDTYVPPPNPQQLLGNVWWRRYIPQDWERWLLPSGWEQWNVDVPLYLYHSLGLRKLNGSTPPEQILSPNTNPGACWPMAGRHGQVTLRLPYPVKVNTITIDHASSLFLENKDEDDDNNNRRSSSAPRNVRIVGYPPCLRGSQEGSCKTGMGFDVNQGVELITFEYNMGGKASQTFSVISSSADVNNGSDDEDELVGGCSATTASCSAPPDDAVSESSLVVAGIMMEVLDNWGNEDYTCIYRFRVHGEAPSE